jgi:hypothetical protein
MRKIFLPVAAVFILAACNNNPKELETKKVVLSTDTTVKANTVFSDTAAVVQPTVVVAPPVVRPLNPAPRVATSRTTNVPRRRTSGRTVTQRDPVNNNTPTQSTATIPDNTSNLPTPSNGNDNNGTNPNNGTNGTSGTANGSTQPQTKKGWDNATKGAVIGGVGGAIGGAIISKKKGKGAIIGGIVGAAGGYILGKKKDKASSDSGR